MNKLQFVDNVADNIDYYKELNEIIETVKLITPDKLNQL
jgi:hypothetical protein